MRACSLSPMIGYGCEQRLPARRNQLPLQYQQLCKWELNRYLQLPARSAWDQVQKRVAVDAADAAVPPRAKKRKTRNLSRPATREMKTRNQFFSRVTWSGEKVVFPRSCVWECRQFDSHRIMRDGGDESVHAPDYAAPHQNVLARLIYGSGHPCENKIITQ